MGLKPASDLTVGELIDQLSQFDRSWKVEFSSGYQVMAECKQRDARMVHIGLTPDVWFDQETGQWGVDQADCEMEEDS